MTNLPFDQPSSTITAAFLAGMGMSLFWLLLSEFYLEPIGRTISPQLVSLSVTFVASLVGYFKKENVLPLGQPVEQPE